MITAMCLWDKTSDKFKRMYKAYQHPKQYQGYKPHRQNVARLRVEDNCLYCDEFCGQEHNFEDCNGRCPYNQYCLDEESAKEMVSLGVNE